MNHKKSIKDNTNHASRHVSDKIILLALLSVPECRARLAEVTAHWDQPIPATGALTLAQIGTYLGVSREWVRRAEKSGLLKLAMHPELKHLSNRYTHEI